MALWAPYNGLCNWNSRRYINNSFHSYARSSLLKILSIQIIRAILKQIQDVDTLMFMVDLRIFQYQDFHLMLRYTTFSRCAYIHNMHAQLSFQVSDRDWRMTFLPQFKACVKAGSWSLMCSYNRYICTN